MSATSGDGLLGTLLKAVDRHLYTRDLGRCAGELCSSAGIAVSRYKLCYSLTAIIISQGLGNARVRFVRSCWKSRNCSLMLLQS